MLDYFAALGVMIGLVGTALGTVVSIVLALSIPLLTVVTVPSTALFWSVYLVASRRFNRA